MNIRLPPSFGDLVYAGSRDGCVYRFNAESGETKGRYCATDLITATPVVDGNCVYFASFDRHVYAVERDTGRIVWKRDVQGEVPRDLALAGHNALAGSRSYDLVALDKATGKPAWTRYYWYSWDRFRREPGRWDDLHRIVRQPAPVRLRCGFGEEAVGKPRSGLVLGEAGGGQGDRLCRRHRHDHVLVGPRSGASRRSTGRPASCAG